MRSVLRPHLPALQAYAEDVSLNHMLNARLPQVA